MKYTNKKLEYLANADLIYPKSEKRYQALLDRSLASKNVDTRPEVMESDLFHEELFWDLCVMINELAGEVLEQREARKEFIKDVQSELQSFSEQLKKKDF